MSPVVHTLRTDTQGPRVTLRAGEVGHDGKSATSARTAKVIPITSTLDASSFAAIRGATTEQQRQAWAIVATAASQQVVLEVSTLDDGGLTIEVTGATDRETVFVIPAAGKPLYFAARGDVGQRLAGVADAGTAQLVRWVAGQGASFPAGSVRLGERSRARLR